MFCSNCGKQLGPGTSFCPACGTRVAIVAPDAPSAEYGSQPLPAGAPPANAPPASRVLLRPRSPRILGGVCAGFALYYGWNLDLVRILMAVFGLFYGVGILAYIACWIILPEGQYALPSESR